MDKKGVGRPRTRSQELRNLHFTVEKEIAEKVERWAESYYGNKTLWFCEMVRAWDTFEKLQKISNPDYSQFFGAFVENPETKNSEPQS